MSASISESVNIAGVSVSSAKVHAFANCRQADALANGSTMASRWLELQIFKANAAKCQQRVLYTRRYSVVHGPRGAAEVPSNAFKAS